MLRETGEIPNKTEVLVLGAGIAGHCAALAAADAGAEVLFLEKAAQPGGSSAIAGGGLVFAGTEHQKEAGLEDDKEELRKGLFASGRNLNNPALVNAFIDNQLDTYHFLRQHRVKFELMAEPNGVPRIHLTGTGRAITTLHMEVQNHPKITFFTKSAAHRLHRASNSGKVTAAHVLFGDREVEIEVTRGIVLATGGFSRSRELLLTFAPELAAGLRHGGTGNTGDGLMMAADLGAGLADLGFVAGSFGGALRNYPDVEQRPDEVAPLLFSFMAGGILVNKNALRFANEGQSYKKLSTVGMEQPDGVAFQIFDEKLMQRSGHDSSVNNFAEGVASGYIKKAGTIAELAGKMGLDPAKLQETVTRYNNDVKNGVDSQFGRTSNLMALDTPSFYIAACANAITSTYGGIAANGDMAVVDWFGQPIEGLFAAGEVVGGFHGGGYYSGTSLSSSATFGRLAGLAAAAA